MQRLHKMSYQFLVSELGPTGCAGKIVRSLDNACYT